MSLDGSEPPDGVVLAVHGRPGVLHDLVVRLAETSNLEVRDADDLDGSRSSSLPVNVLVEPGSRDWIEARRRGGPIVVVATKQDDGDVLDAILAGASSVLSREISGEILVDAVITAHRGGTVITSRQATLLAAVARANNGGSRHLAAALTPRESEILALIARGRSVKQTSLELGVSTKTVENLQSRLYRKLGVRNRAQAVRQGHALGLLSDVEDTPP